MTPTLRLSLAAVMALGLTLAGCGDSRKQHASDGDTGAAAPATVRDMSATPTVGDSTAAVSTSTGGGAMAGTTDTTRKSAVPGTPAKP
jgi:hypothetical protein